MNKKDIAELRKRLKKSDCTMTKVCGCYVNSDKEIILNIDESFLNLDDDEFDKYLTIAMKALSGRLGNNLLQLNFPLEEEFTGGKQQFLMELRDSKLKNEELLNTFYQLIIDNYDYPGNYLILVFHDVYDIIKKTTDNLSLDESDSVHEYLICAICPVELTKAGLGYLEDENRIGPRHRDWMVSNPDAGFTFPAFSDRSSDIHSAIYYTRRPLVPHVELMESVLGCPAKATATEKKNTFHTIIKKAVNTSEDESKIYGNIQESLNLLSEEQAALSDSPEEPLLLTQAYIQDILTESSIEEEITNKIKSAYEESFKDEPPVIDDLIDKKTLAENEKRKVEKALMEKVEVLQEELHETKSAANEVAAGNIDDMSDVVLHVKPEKVEQITTRFIEGKKSLIIPIEDDDEITVNGIKDLM